MNQPQKKENGWTSPQMLYAIGASLFGFYGSFVGFQKDTGTAVAVMKTEVDGLKEAVASHTRRLDARDEADLAEARLERHK